MAEIFNKYAVGPTFYNDEDEAKVAASVATDEALARWAQLTADATAARTALPANVDPDAVVPLPAKPDPVEPMTVKFTTVWDIVTEAGALVVVGVNEDLARAECDRLKNDIDGDPSVVFTLATREVQVD